MISEFFMFASRVKLRRHYLLTRVEVAMRSNPFSFLLDQLEQKLPDSLRPMQAEFKSAARSLLDDKLAQFDWVPRSEFEAQARLLAQAEERIAALEAKLDGKA